MKCVRGEGVQGVLTLFCSGAAQVCHDDRVVELKEQLEVEEEDGDKQEEEVEVEKEKSSQRECAMWMTMDGDMKCAQNLSHEVCGVIIKCGTEMRAQAQCMYATRPLKCRCIVSTSSLVSCLVSCMLLFTSFHLLFVMML